MGSPEIVALRTGNRKQRHANTYRRRGGNFRSRRRGKLSNSMCTPTTTRLYRHTHMHVHKWSGDLGAWAANICKQAGATRIRGFPSAAVLKLCMMLQRPLRRPELVPAGRNEVRMSLPCGNRNKTAFEFAPEGHTAGKGVPMLVHLPAPAAMTKRRPRTQRRPPAGHLWR